MADIGNPGDEAMYRALGRFFVEFSQMLHAMETSVVFYLQGGNDPRFLRAVLAGREAKPIVDGYFALCAELGDTYWSNADRAAIRALRREIEALVTDRNRFAHDVWFVAWTSTSDAGTQPLPPERSRDRVSKTGVAEERQPVTARELEQRADDADRLRRLAGNTLGLVVRYAMEHGGPAVTRVKTVGDGPPAPIPSISEQLTVRDGRLVWATWPASDPSLAGP